jgi:Zn-dependent protease
MQTNFTLLRIWGIPIRIHISLVVFLPILAWLIGSGEQIAVYADVITAITPATLEAASLDGPNDRWIIGIAAALGLFTSVTFHELGHSWMAMRYDIEVDSITLWLLGGLAALSEMPDEWEREFWIAIAGPLSSVLLGVGFMAALFAVPESLTLVVFIFGFLAVMNLVLATFNMLPAFPMDGGRILRALLARRRSYVSATQTAARIGVGFAILFVFLGVIVFSPILLLLALFIYVAATSESRTVVLTELLAGFTVEDVITDTEPISGSATLDETFDRLLSARRSDLAVVDEDGTVIGVVTAESLKSVEFGDYENTTVESVARTDLHSVDIQTSAFDALSDLMSRRYETAIVQRDGAPIGVVSREDFTALLDLRRDTVPF